MEKLDLRKEYQQLYQPSARQPAIVDVPAFNFLMADGANEPGVLPGDSPTFQEATQALYGLSYTLKFMSKLRKESPRDYTVMTLEGLWWIEQGEFDIRQPGNWKWTLMILQPAHITVQMVQEGLAQLRKKNPSPGLERLRFESFHEGLCVQMMHIGPYATEPATVDKLQACMTENGLRDRVGLGGKHHEIYLSDPRRSDPHRLKTVLRHPVERPRP